MHEVVSSQRKAEGKSIRFFKQKKPLLDYLPKAWRYSLLALGISGAVYLAARYAIDRSNVQEQWPQQVQQLQIQAPKVTLRVDGWRAFFDFSVPAGSRISYSFVNLATHDTAYWKEKFHGYKSAYYYAVAPVEYSRGKSEGVIMPLSPFEDNRIVAELYLVGPNGHRKLVYWLDSVFSAPKKFVSRSRFTTLTTEEPYDRQAAQEILEVADEINRLLPPSKRIGMLLGNREKSNPTGSYERYAEHYLRNMNLAAGSDKIFEDKLLARWLVFHEYCHGYYENMLVSGDYARMKDVYARLMQAAGFKPYPFPSGAMAGREDLVLFALMEADPLLSLFDESHYLKMVRKGDASLDVLGSPWRNEAELFASCSTNLWASGGKFFEGLAELERMNPQQGRLVREAASVIVGMWSKGEVIPKEVRSRLGLQ